MHYSVLNRATVRVANTRDVSGRVTADSINNGSRAERISSPWRACGLMIFCSAVSVGVLASLTPVPALADEDEGIRKEIAALKKQVAGLQSQVEALQDQLAAVQSNNALKLGKFVTVDPNPEKGVRGPNITFKGANIHIVSGSGATDDNTLFFGGTMTGLGNLIIGYDEPLPNVSGNRGGSHNLVIGMFHTFTSSAFGGLVAGEQNTISAEAASVIGGFGNTANGTLASVSGGDSNTASGLEASVSGGQFSIASGVDSSVSGGDSNTASGGGASVSGGVFNTASGFDASVSGGNSNTASGDRTVVIGGANVTDNNIESIAPQPPFPP